MNKGIIAQSIGLVLSCVVCACAVGDDSAHEFDVDSVSFRDDGGNRSDTRDPGGGLWLGNGLQYPSVGGFDPKHALNTPEGLAEDPALLDDPEYLKTTEYTVECALGLGQSVTKVVNGQTVVLSGRAGLAPEWQTGVCDENCQQWVSACLLARTNITGQEVVVSLRSNHPAIGTQADPDYTLFEASWYGNLFTDPPSMNFCWGGEGGLIEASVDGRTCSTGSYEDCDFVARGMCSSEGLCQSEQGVYVDCKADGVQYNTIATYLDES